MFDVIYADYKLPYYNRVIINKFYYSPVKRDANEVKHNSNSLYSTFGPGLRFRMLYHNRDKVAEKLGGESTTETKKSLNIRSLIPCG